MEVEFKLNPECGQNVDGPVWMLLYQQYYRDAKSLKLGLESRKPGFTPGLFHMNQVTLNKSLSL